MSGLRDATLYFEKNKKYIYNNLVSYAVIVLNIFILIFATRFLIQKLGKDDYGTWLFILNILGYLLLIHLGYSSTLISKFHLFQKTLKDQNKFFTIFGCLGLFLGLLGCLIGFVVSVNLDTFFQSKQGLYQAQKALLYTLPGFLFGFLCLFIESVLVVYHRMLNYKSVLDFIRGGGLSILFCVWIYFYGIDIAYLGLIYSIVSGCVFISNCIFFAKYTKFAWDLDVSYFGYLYSYLPGSAMYWLLSISSIFLAQADFFYIAYFLKDMSLITVYSQSFRLSEIFSRFIKKLTENKAPKIIHFYKEGDMQGLRKLVNRLVLLSFLSAFVAAIFIAVFGTSILNLWLGKYLTFDIRLVSIFALLLITNSLYWVYWMVMNLVEKQNFMFYIAILEITINVALSLILMKEYKLLGLAFASLIANSVSLLLVFLFFNKQLKTIGVSVHS